MDRVERRLAELCGGSVERATDEAVFSALLRLTKEEAEARVEETKGRRLYYVSAEFLLGKLLSNNLINLGLYDEVKACLERSGKSMERMEELDAEPSLGNGGLGRLAACFLDSLATLNLPGDGVGLLYHCGLFKQRFEDGRQKETPDCWLDKEGWAEKTDTVYPIEMGGREYRARLCRIAVTGYGGRTNMLNLFDLEGVDEGIIGEGISFPKKEIDKNLTLFLYPDDSDEEGRLLRLYQQYFMVSAGARLILDECMARGCRGADLADYAAIQINDTHPSMIIPELIRLLMDRGVSLEAAAETVTKTCAYTNHTILSEALEKWPMSAIEAVAPQIVPIIRKLNEIARSRSKDDSTAIIDENDVVHMAHMDIHFTHSTNGVAWLHTEILKHSELAQFYRLYPERFSSKTNGITFRRWLIAANPLLTEMIERHIGSGFKKDAMELSKLRAFAEDEETLLQFGEVKKANKHALAEWLEEKQGVRVDPAAMFSVQAKRLHEYKRQQLNLLFLIHQLLEIREGRLPVVPLVSLFGAKAAPAYVIAKDIIHAIKTLGRVIEKDEAASRWMQVVFLENYNVTAAEKLLPACDLSEQISLAGKEASGTGNMKLMLNGAVTIGTRDGANVEIAQQAGEENIYLFGQSAQQVMRCYKRGDYCAREWYESDPNIKRAIDFLTSDEMLEHGRRENLERLQNELICRDWFKTLPDFNAYLVRKTQAMADYAANPMRWRKMSLLNIASAGYFSSDRTIAEYDKDIWHLG